MGVATAPIMPKDNPSVMLDRVEDTTASPTKRALAGTETPDNCTREERPSDGVSSIFPEYRKLYGFSFSFGGSSETECCILHLDSSPRYRSWFPMFWQFRCHRLVAPVPRHTRHYDYHSKSVEEHRAVPTVANFIALFQYRYISVHYSCCEEIFALDIRVPFTTTLNLHSMLVIPISNSCLRHI